MHSNGIGECRRMMQQMKSALEQEVDYWLTAAEESKIEYETSRDTLETDTHHSTTVVIENAWQRFEIRLGPQGGFRRAEYNTTGWGEGEVVDEEKRKDKARSLLRKMIDHPNPYED